RVPLDEDQVAAERVRPGAEEVAEADLVERGRGGVGGDVAADAPMPARAQAQRHRVPAQVRIERQLHRHVAREGRLLRRVYRVDVGRRERGAVAAAAGGVLLQQFVDEEVRAA